MPKKYNFLNDGGNEELFLDEIILNIKNGQYYELNSTSSPKYITAISSEICFTTDKS